MLLMYEFTTKYMINAYLEYELLRVSLNYVKELSLNLLA